MANKIRLTVGGISYSVYSEDSEEYVREIGRELEHKMDKLAKNNPFLSTTMVAVLAALDATDALKKAEAQNNELINEIKALSERCALARSDADHAVRQLEEYKRTNGEI
ncbi:MAG: cell division protein ZapA [Ruminococcaceae bacterium]|nr:cell division protein ZapA [Oscillospiraceae bacterium]